MTDSPAPPDDGAAIYKPSWQDLFLHCLAERDRADILREHCANEGGMSRAARHARTVAIFEALLRLVDRCEKSEVITAELRRIAAAAQRDGRAADDEAGADA